ncbi:amidohydrolase [Actinoallomurus oryzae]|uniref:Amidohydrolase n=1 Tax=Actinoallomurus oryzae TaxID=502180 RepID=A0ABP8P9C9_9ACTN
MDELNELHLKLRAAVADELPAAVALRHRLHADPRLSGDEADTAAEVVRALGAGPGRRVAGTGRTVRIGGRGPAVALRAELDALPVTERTGVSWASANDAMHACGHDVHLAALVAICRAAERIGVDVPVLAVLQPREETSPSGAEDIVGSGVLTDHDVRAMVAAHVQPRLADGVVAVTPGPVNAATDEFEVTVTGLGGHAGYPHVARDPVLALCQIVVSLQHLASRRFDPVLGAVCSVGRIGGGTAANVVPETASARGTVRVMRDSDRAVAASLITEIVTHTAAAHGCEGHARFFPGEPVLVNDPALASDAAGRLTDDGVTVDAGFRSYGADDFSHYCDVTRGLMMFIGTAPPDATDAPGLHTERFLPGDHMVGRTADALLAGYLAAIRTAVV